MNSRVTKIRSKTSERYTSHMSYYATLDLVATDSTKNRQSNKRMIMDDPRVGSN